MLSFLQYIKETLNYDQQFYIDNYINWDNPEKRDVDFSDHLFDRENPPEGGKVVGKDTVVFDVSKPQLKPEFDVSDYLRYRGYAIHDYGKGLARREGSKRLISIGKILSKPHEAPTTPFDANAPEWQEHRSREFHRNGVLSTFMNSDVRQAMRTPLELLVTRDPYKVAEMSANKPRWSSCLTLGTCPSRDLIDIDWEPGDEQEKVPYDQQKGYQRPGQYVRALEGELLSGTHVGYLIAAGDHELKNPFARISLKPYHSEDIREKENILYRTSRRGGGYRGHSWEEIKPQHTILRPSMSIYTSDNIHHHSPELLSALQSAVDRVTRTHFPMKFAQYHLDPMSYRDGGDRSHWQPKHDEHEEHVKREEPPAPPGPPGYYEDEYGNIRIR